MQYLKFLPAIVFSSCLLFACSNNATSSTNDTPVSTGSSGNGSFSYTISGNKTAVKNLYRNEVKNDVANGRIQIEITNSATSEVFKLSVGNTGTTAVLHYRPSLSNFRDVKTSEATYMSPQLKNYYGDSVTVSITSVDASHVTGTFSGKYLLGDDKAAVLEITEGNFDLPFTKDEPNN